MSGRTVFIVQSVHHYIPGLRREVYSNRAAADKAALEMLNTIRCDVTDEETDIDLTPWTGDWESGLADTREHLSASSLYTGDEMDVWIEESVVHDS